MSDTNDQIKQLQEQLEQANQLLIKQENERGMAELAAGVLHNIGNTLTPSKIAISMLLQRLQKSPLLNHIGSILKPLEDIIPKSDLPEEEKQKLLKILQVLPGSIEEEYKQAIADVANIRDKQEHIASIIALHMRYAHLKADYFEVNISRLIEDALSMQSESLSKRAITIKKDLPDVMHVKVQESKILQILINLIKNAYEAIDMNSGGPKQIEIKCFKENDQNVIIKITDSGIGFDSKQEQKFFDFGYTSKEEGTGFGLHFCALFLESIGGEITASSDGIGKGAVFTIRLPFS